MNAERVALWCAMLFLACSPAGGFTPAVTMLHQASRCVHSQLQRRGTTSPLGSRSVAIREAVPASGRRAFSGHRTTPVCTPLSMQAATTDAAGAASTVIQVGGRDVILDDKSLREAFEKSDDDSQVSGRG